MWLCIDLALCQMGPAHADDARLCGPRDAQKGTADADDACQCGPGLPARGQLMPMMLAFVFLWPRPRTPSKGAS